MRLTAVVLTVACALGFATASPFSLPPPPNATIEECPGSTNKLTIDYVNLSPNPPRRGQALSIDAGGFLAENIVNGAKIDIIVKAGLVKLLTRQLDFCEESVKINMTCPIVAGKQSVQQTVDLPKEIPPGKYTVNIRVTNPGPDEKPGDLITCLIARATFTLV